MGDGAHTIHLVTGDESLLASTRAAAAGLEGWTLVHHDAIGALQEAPPAPGDVVLLDTWLKGQNVYEACSLLTGRTGCRTFVLADDTNALAAPIARFCGATGALSRPLTGQMLRDAFEGAGAIEASLPSSERGAGPLDRQLPQRFLEDLVGPAAPSLISAMTDPETGLFSYDFLKFKLDEEFKRGRRFHAPLSCVRLGFEGQADDATLQQLASIFLQASRDTDILGRFDQSSFLFLLPQTGPKGASIMARRISELAQREGLRDLVGDTLSVAVGISTYPHPDVETRDDLFGQACEAFEAALHEGGGVVTAG